SFFSKKNIDDFAEYPTFTRQSKMRHSLYVRGRHNMISTKTTTQKIMLSIQLLELMQRNYMSID
ncbi:MAG: hypothetical protein ACKPKO_53180, partial [Candidatus Fonsibacter sp.]